MTDVVDVPGMRPIYISSGGRRCELGANTYSTYVGTQIKHGRQAGRLGCGECLTTGRGGIELGTYLGKVFRTPYQVDGSVEWY